MNLHRQASRLPQPPMPNREFRGAWIATVANIDWPSKPGLSAAKQKAEAIRILDTLSALHMNVAILQVRTCCDALYDSKLEPWSYYLTGHQGQSPGYDPLAFWITEAHRRGIELHAWINPFRAKPADAHYPNSPDHVSRSHPDWVIRYTDNKQTLLWLDPGNPAAMDHAYAVVMDIVRRYNIDGIHIDDYFYPYPLHDKNKDIIPFPDGASYARYWQSGGRMNLDDWRRSNINHFIHRIYTGIHAEKKWVKFGISPFGIYRPGNPPGVSGFDAYAEIYCDSKLWLQKGWLDYLVPQLYWKLSSPKQNFLSLLTWWKNEDRLNRPLCAGLYTGLLEGHKWCPDEIGDQIGVVRAVGAAGEVHFSAKSLVNNDQNIDKLLIGKNGLYEQPALVPASSWLSHSVPASPRVQVKSDPTTRSVAVSWHTDPSVWQWAVQTLSGSQWTLHVYPSSVTHAQFKKQPKQPSISAVAVRAVNRCGITSSPIVIKVTE